MQNAAVTPRPGAAPAPRALSAGFFGLIALTYGLIVLGALVRAHEAGLACPDWPLCFGEFVPRFDLKVGFEWGHRLVAGSVSVLFVALGVGIFLSPDARRAAGRLWGLGALLLAVQVILGALTVWLKLAEWTVTAHLVTGNSFNVCLLFLALSLREQAVPVERRPLARGARRAVAVAFGLLVLQMILGGLVSSSFSGMACPEWPTCNGGEWFPTLQGSVGLHLAHRMNGYAFVVAAGVAAWSTRGQGRVFGLSVGVTVLAGFQITVGIANVLLGLPVEVTGLHSALAAALVLGLSASLREAWLAPADARRAC